MREAHKIWKRRIPVEALYNCCWIAASTENAYMASSKLEVCSHELGIKKIASKGVHNKVIYRFPIIWKAMAEPVWCSDRVLDAEPRGPGFEPRSSRVFFNRQGNIKRNAKWPSLLGMLNWPTIFRPLDSARGRVWKKGRKLQPKA